ncbi:hypothetical protein ACLOJK_009447 [Asimina triloba]
MHTKSKWFAGAPVMLLHLPQQTPTVGKRKPWPLLRLDKKKYEKIRENENKRVKADLPVGQEGTRSTEKWKEDVSDRREREMGELGSDRQIERFAGGKTMTLLLSLVLTWEPMFRTMGRGWRSIAMIQRATDAGRRCSSMAREREEEGRETGARDH